MPDIGTIVRGRDIGKSKANPNNKFIWLKCPTCGKQRWVTWIIAKRREYVVECGFCSSSRNGKSQADNVKGPNNPMFKGGTGISTQGYVWIWVDETHPYYCMSHNCKSHSKHGGQIMIHRLMMAEHLGRPLGDRELVHHLNGIKTDNRFENLSLTTMEDHARHHTLLRHRTEGRFGSNKT
jgi:ribosomal protein S27E